MTNKNIQPQQMDYNFPASQLAGEELDLRELLIFIWEGRWSVILLTAIFAVGAVLFAVGQPNIYKSSALLAPSNAQQGGGLGGLASQFGGLASMAGINLGAGGTDKTQIALEVMKSRKFTNEFIKRHDLLPHLFAVKEWNMSNDSLVFNSEIYNEELKSWVGKAADGVMNRKPSSQEAFRAFSQKLKVDVARDTGLITVSIEYISPSIAKQWVDWLVQDVNKVMKERDVAEAQQSSDFLIKQIAKTNVADIRSILYKLIEEQAKTIMFAEVRDEYIFKTIDPAIVPELKVSPKRAAICVLGTLFGSVFALLILLVRFFFLQKII